MCGANLMSTKSGGGGWSCQSKANICNYQLLFQPLYLGIAIDSGNEVDNHEKIILFRKSGKVDCLDEYIKGYHHILYTTIQFWHKVLIV